MIEERVIKMTKFKKVEEISITDGRRIGSAGIEVVLPVRFFKFDGTGSYYSAFIKAVDEEDAVAIYNKLVSSVETEENKSDLLESMKELTLSEAILEMQGTVGEDGEKLADTDILEQLADEELELMNVDRALL